MAKAIQKNWSSQKKKISRAGAEASDQKKDNEKSASRGRVCSGGGSATCFSQKNVVLPKRRGRGASRAHRDKGSWVRKKRTWSKSGGTVGRRELKGRF